MWDPRTAWTAFGQGVCRGMKISTGIAATAMLLLATSGVQAATLAIEGLYGNETGCRVAAGGEYTSDDKFVLDAEGFEAHESGCEFVAVHPSRSGAELAIALCQGEGSLWTRSVIVSPADPEGDSLLVFFDTGDLWHEVRPCQQ